MLNEVLSDKHKLTPGVSQAQGEVLDRRRRGRFLHAEDSFIENCTPLGLFQTKMPRFDQLFFHDFLKHEVVLQLGQTTTSVSSQRAARTYLMSGVRLESKCGLSDVWYHYVDSHRYLFEVSTEESPSVDDYPHPRLDKRQASAIYDAFEWYKQHSRPRPTRRVQVATPTSTPGEPFSKSNYKKETPPSGNGECGEESAYGSEADDGGTSEEGEEFVKSESHSAGLSYEGDVSESSDCAWEEDAMEASDDLLEDIEEGSVKEEDGDPQLGRWSASYEETMDHPEKRDDKRPEDFTDASDDELDNENEDTIKDEASDLELEPWTASFERAVVDYVSVEDGNGVPMDGVELSQPTGGQTHKISDDTDEDGTAVQNGEYASYREPAAFYSIHRPGADLIVQRTVH